MSIKKTKIKSTFMLDNCASKILKQEAERTGLSQTEIVNCALRNLKIVNVECGIEIIRNVYELRREVKQLKILGEQVSKFEENLDDAAIKLYEPFDDSAYQMVKYKENNRKNKAYYRVKHSKNKNISIN